MEKHKSALSLLHEILLYLYSGLAGSLIIYFVLYLTMHGSVKIYKEQFQMHVLENESVILFGLDMLNLLICSLLLIVFLKIMITRKVHYLSEMLAFTRQVSSGNLSARLPIRGHDELAELARSLNQMTSSLSAKEQQNISLKESQNTLLLKMSHDLRTPLTGLTAYLELLKRSKLSEQAEEYVEKVLMKADEIHSMSDQIFDYFFISTSYRFQMEAPDFIEYALGEPLSSLISLLVEDGYLVSYDSIEWKELQISVCTDYLQRIINNIYSNIRKYADSERKITITLSYEKKMASVSISNMAAEQMAYVKGTGIGTENIKMMMEQMGGECTIQITGNQYQISLSFPILQC